MRAKISAHIVSQKFCECISAVPKLAFYRQLIVLGIKDQGKIFCSLLKKRAWQAVCAAIALFQLQACNPAKKLKPGQYLVHRVAIELPAGTRLDKNDLEDFFRQKPNRRLFRKIPFFVWWHNLFDAEKIRKKKLERNRRFDQKNQEKVKRFEEKNLRRARKGKKPKIPRLKDKESQTFLESLRDIGEPPVILDSLQTAQTRFQLSRYLFSKGYFNNVVTDSVKILHKKKRAEITYHLQPGPAYRMYDISYEIEDSVMASVILADTSNSLIRLNRRYDAGKLQEERQRITDHVRNNGYYAFENAYISFDVDTTFEGNKVSVNVHVSKFSRPGSTGADSVERVNHTRYRIENVFVITEPVIGNVREAHFTDTVPSAKGISFLLNRPLAYKEFMLVNNIDMYRGQLFRRDSAQQTYKQLLSLGIFKNVVIHFLPSPGYSRRLDCYIVCSPLIKQSLTAETELINTSGNQGIDGSIVYQNRNFFSAGELIELKLQGSIVAQQQLREQEQTASNIDQLPRSFNTIQFGPELTFSVPRAFFPFSLFPFRKHMSPRTYVKTSFNYQSRPDFSRVIQSIDYGFNFRTHNNLLRHTIIPAQVYFVRARLSSDFSRTLRELNDAFLVNSFQDHVTTLSRYSLTYFSSENVTTSRKPVNYIRWSIQSSGSLLRLLFNATNRPQDSLGRYTLYGIPFAHFVRSDIDYRLYIPVRRRSRVVYRVAAGVGKPLTNLGVLPYEQSFFSGGPNSVRAWRARTLGPGAYDPRNSNARFDKIGDIQLEGNFEYRFHIIKDFHGAAFVDAGNIWRLQPDDNKPGAEFLVDEFIDQIAIGGGLGLRWDLNFFVLRLDFALPLKDPKYEVGDRWTFNKRPWRQTVLNFGIGYPF